MDKLFICPSPRASVSFLSEHKPLAAVPLLGQSLLEYWLSAASSSGVKNVTVLAADRPDCLREIAGDGARWGIQVEVISESREFTPAEAILKYAPEPSASAAEFVPQLLDHFPGLPKYPLFSSYAALFEALREWMPHATTIDRVGVREVRPGIWTGLHSSVSTKAELHPPCWIGSHAFVGPGCVIGPNAVVEDGAFVEEYCSISEGCVGRDTFVGAFVRLEGSWASGNALIDLRTGSRTNIMDPFLLCPLRRPRVLQTQSLLARLTDLIARTRDESSLVWKHLLINKQG